MNTWKDYQQQLWVELSRGHPNFPILGFHPRDPPLGNGCYPPCWCPSKVIKTSSNRCKSAVVDMVVCIVGCCRKSENKNTQRFFRISSFVKNKGEEFEETTTKRRNLWISAGSRDDDQETWSWRIRVKSSQRELIRSRFDTILFSWVVNSFTNMA